jgi:hypothetical protein
MEGQYGIGLMFPPFSSRTLGAGQLACQAVGTGCPVPFFFLHLSISQPPFKSPVTKRPAVEFYSVTLLLRAIFVASATVWQRKMHRPAKSGLNIVLKSILSGLSC